jgi:hypothetical protein
MKVLFQILVASIISMAFITGAQAQSDNNDNQINTTAKSQEQIGLKDQNQNQGEMQNREHNRVIHGPNFVDKNNDGFNDNAPDHDGDGIPNGRDADYTGSGKGEQQKSFIDENGDGIADRATKGAGAGYRNGRQSKNGYGPADGSGNRGVRPQNGSGYGPGAKSGNCDGTGPKGNKINRNNSK